MARLNETPSGMRTHIGVFGKVNSGKSSLINALTGQEVSIVSDVEGTTTDPVYKAIEIQPIGPCLFIDTAGFSDETELGRERLKKTRKVATEADIAIIIFEGETIDEELKLVTFFKKNKTPVIYVVNRADEAASKTLQTLYRERLEEDLVLVSAKSGEGIDHLREVLIEKAQSIATRSIVGDLVSEGDSVLLVMPQDKQAPKGRLILPQVTTLRELLDKHCVIISCATEEIDDALSSLREPPKLIITDSQVFDIVYEKKPSESLLTSFSVLYAGLKGDVQTYIDGAKSIASLQDGAKILIAESCSHAPLDEDIGRVKIPNLLRKKVGEHIEVEVSAGKDFPSDLSSYDLIVQCGGCMVNRKAVMARIEQAAEAKVPITNYGIAIAYLKGILDKISV